MLKPFIIIIFVFIRLSVQGQHKIKNYVIERTIPIASIDPETISYADLEPIGNAIGDANIVMLGEQDHGDAPTFLAKRRLIKYLHEKKGFNILAFESDFFGLNYGWDQLNKTKPEMDSFFNNNIFPIWTLCYTCKDLFGGYIPSTYQTDKPLYITGFDNQLVLGYSSRHLVNYIDSTLRKLELPITKQENYSSGILPLIDSIKYWKITDTNFFARSHQCLETIKLQATGKIQPNSFFEIILDNLIQENKMHQSDIKNRLRGIDIRDHQMAENLKWLSLHKYSNEKIIVWAANAHIANYIYNDLKNNEAKIATMGHYIKSDSTLSPKTYILGFTSYEGEAGRLGYPKYKIRKPQRNGFETWIDPSVKYSFTDFKAFNNSHNYNPEVFYLKGLGHKTAFKKDWNNAFDGIFFIRDMYSCQE